MPADGLALLQQTDFSAGAFTQEARELVSANGLTDAINALINEDGLPFRRGGSSYKSNAGFGAGGRFLWDGYLAAGQRTFFADANDFAILSPDDATPFNLGGSGFNTPSKAASLNGMLFLPGGGVYGGSRKTAGVSRSGEVIVAVKGSPVIQTANPPVNPWNDGSIDAGMLLRISSGLGDGRYYAVKSIDNDHQVTLASPYLGDDFVDFVDFSFQPLGSLSWKLAPIYFVVANRLIACVDDTAYESDARDPTHFTDNELQRVPAGVQILGGEAVRDTAVLFTTGGIWSIGNVALRLTDGQGNVQQRFEQVNRDIVLWSWPGVATWGATLIVPAIDGVYLFDPVSAPQNIVGGMRSLYRSYVDAGYHTGIATVYKGHYELPILDAAETVVDTLVCRLQPTRRGRGISFAWSRKSGDGSNMTALAVRVPTATARQPYLIGIHRDTGRIHRLNDFEPAVANATDANGSAHVAELVTPEYRISTTSVENLCRRLRVRYELVDPAAANPVLQLAYSLDGGAWVDLADTAPEATMSDDPFPWNVNKRARGIRFRIRTSGAVASFVLHSIEAFVRQSGKQ